MDSNSTYTSGRFVLGNNNFCLLSITTDSPVTVKIICSSDGTNYYTSDTILTTGDSTAELHYLKAAHKYMKYQVLTAGTAITVFQHSMKLMRRAPGHATNKDEPLPLTAFGELSTAQFAPQIQISFPYDNLHSQLYYTYTNGGSSSVVPVNGLCTLTTGNTAGDYTVLRSRKQIRYRPGQGTVARFTAIFNTPSPYHWQFAGLGHGTDAIYFACIGNNFAVGRQTGGIYHSVRLTLSAAATTNETATITLNTVDFNVPLTAAAGNIPYIAHQIASFAFSGWTTSHEGNWIDFTATAAGARAGVYGISSNTAAGSFTTKKTGYTGSLDNHNWTFQTAWNVDKMDGTGPSKQILDITKGNVYQIEFQYLGFGALKYYVENKETGRFQLVHVEKYANTNVVPSMARPSFSLQFAAYCVANGGSSITLKTSSMMAATQGVINSNIPQYGISKSKVSIGTSPILVLALRNRPFINGLPTQSEINITSISVAVEGSKPFIAEVYLATTESGIGAGTSGDFSNWTPISDTESIAAVDASALTATGGNLISVLTLAKADNQRVDISKFPMTLSRDQIMYVTVRQTIGGSGGDATVACNWIEDI